MRLLVSRSVLVSLIVVCSAVVLSACANVPLGWNDGPGWRLSGSPTPIPPEKVYGSATTAAPGAKAPLSVRPVASPAGAQPKAGEPRVVIVGPDDTLTGISSRYRTSISAIMAANGMATPRIVPGQRLIIPAR